MTVATPVRWGFLGAGFVASQALGPAVHAAEGAVLQVVGSREGSRARALEPMRVETSYQAVCDAEDVDVVYVALPNDDHQRWVCSALRAGKHVLCEKPLGLDAAEVVTMSAAAAEADRMLVEASWNRWHPRTRRAETLLADRAGLRDVSAWFTFSGVPADNYRLDPRKGGGALLDLGPYVVAAAGWALGGDLAVNSSVQQRAASGVDLTTTAVLSGALGCADVTMSIDRAETQGMHIDAPGLHLAWADEAFTSWRAGATLRVVEDGRSREEAFVMCDAYQLMVEAVSARVGGHDAWVLPLTTSAAVARALDAIAAAAA